MKKLLLPLFLMTACLGTLTTSQAADPKPKEAAAPVTLPVTLSNKEKGTAMTNFSANEPIIVANFKGDTLAKGDKIRFDWIAEKAKGISKPNKVIFQNTQEAKGPNTFGSSTLNKPPGGWPAGSYRVDAFVNGKKLASNHFTVG